MTNRLFYWSLTSALAGFLFGFDTVVISGAEQTIEAVWQLDTVTHGLAMGAALWGTVLGSLLGGWPTDKFGRRKTLIAVGALYFISALWSGLATGVYTFMLARFIGGIGVGVATVAAPLFISEISPPERRGALAAMFQFNIVFGIMIAYVSNALLSGIGPTAWRWMLGIEALPAIIYTLMCFGLPESPRWLIAKRNDRDAALHVLRKATPERSSLEIEALADEIVAASNVEKQSIAGFWSKSMRVPILLAFLVAFFNQMSGVNAIFYYAPRIFELAGMSAERALQVPIGIGVVNIIFTFLGMRLIDHLGRKTLLLVGSFGYIASLGGCAWAFFAQQYVVVGVCVLLFAAAHAVGQGAVIWVLISEIFPNRFRAMGQALGSFTHWIFAAIIATSFPPISAAVDMGYVFLFFCGMMVLQLIWVATMVPETKGVPLEEMERKLGVTP
ncbi:MAG: sugar porter family MFS transporter [Blastopirellula sp. JB062]